MNDLSKVSSLQIYLMLKSVTISLLMPVLVLSLSILFPVYVSPIISLVCIGFLYSTIITNQKSKDRGICMLVLYAMLVSLIVYTFVTLVLNVLAAWKVIPLPPELYFLNQPYLPSLALLPSLFVTFLYFTLRRHTTSFCVKCRLRNGSTLERGKTGAVISYSVKLTMRNLTLLFGTLSAIIWYYYLYHYVNINQNSRDWYIFLWLVVIFFILAEVYFIFRFYNLYLDLKEENQLLTLEDLQEMTPKTYLRCYLICDNQIYLFDRQAREESAYVKLLDTPFVYIYEQAHVPESDVMRQMRKATGLDQGTLRPFYRIPTPDIKNHFYQRYFYFLDGKPEDYPELATQGKWWDFEKVKRIYATNPDKLGRQMLSDLTRLATIIITEKIFDEEGNRKNPLRSYTPSYNLHDVRTSQLDFQDDKWLRISNYNEDNRSFRMRRLWRRLFRRSRMNLLWL